MKRLCFSALALLLCSSVAVGGTILEIKNKNEVTTVLTDGQQARMTMGGDEYAIVDYKTRIVRMVNPQKQEVLLLSPNTMPAGASGPRINTRVNQKGAGITVVGYKTQKFEYSANGKSCGVIYGSKDAFQAKGIKELFNAMKTMIERQQAILGGLAGMLDVCTLADMKISDHVNSIGVPMRMEKNGQVEMEIKSIKLNADIAANTFKIPASYRTMTVQEQMNAMKYAPAMQQKMQQQQPPMHEMMQQMQQSGQLSPEIMQQMRQAQEMMQQYQQ